MKTKLTFVLLILLTQLFTSSCSEDESTKPDNIDYKQEMRDFVIGISEYAKSINPNFFIIPQNGIELVISNGEEDGTLNTSYLNAIDGNGQEDLFYGYVNDDQATPTNENSYLRTFLDKSKSAGNIILITDYCSTSAKMDASYNQNNAANYVSFAANHRELNNIPNYPNPIYLENNTIVDAMANVKNFLYLINPENYSTKSDFITAITSKNYDLLIMDLFFQDGTEFVPTEIAQLRNKANGGKRLILSYMSIGEAEDYRFYWQENWTSNKPDWVEAENPDWEGNYKVKYWKEEWQNIIFGNETSYLKKILDVGFDGTYLDIIDAYEYFEEH